MKTNVLSNDGHTLKIQIIYMYAHTHTHTHTQSYFQILLMENKIITIMIFFLFLKVFE